MENEIIQHKSWLSRNWKWLTLAGVMLVAGFTLFIVLLSDGNPGDFATALNDKKLYSGAIEKANKSPETLQVLGALEPVGSLAILESNIEYTNDNKSVNATVRVSGSKGKAKMDIKAHKEQGRWKYSLIKLRIKKTKQEILILY